LEDDPASEIGRRPYVQGLWLLMVSGKTPQTLEFFVRIGVFLQGIFKFHFLQIGDFFSSAY